MIIEIMESAGDIYIDSLGFINALCIESECAQIIKEEELTYAQMNEIPQEGYIKGIAPIVDGKYWIKTMEGRTVKIDVISIGQDNSLTFNWAIKI
jgi:hypothetical protein